VIADSTNLMIPPLLGLAISRSITRTCLNPMPIRAAILCRTDWQTNKSERLQCGKACNCSMFNFQHQFRAQSPTMALDSLDVS
jgi:hypothetical protein